MNYSEILLKAMDIISKRNVELTNYDTTILCTILENKGNGEYLVSNGSAKFTAYTTVGEYSIQDQVYVNIPCNDYNQQKFIVGKYVENLNTPINYTKPFDNLLDITNNLISFSEPMSLLANGETEYINSTVKDVSSLGNQGLTKIGISADFQTKLSGFNVAKGNYGIRLFCVVSFQDEITGQDDFLLRRGDIEEILINFEAEKKEEINAQLSQYNNDNGNYVVKYGTANYNNLLEIFKSVAVKVQTLIFDFSTSNMIGNPYNFDTYQNQQIIFSIPDYVETIEAISYQFYQEKNFYNKLGELIPYSYKNQNNEEEFYKNNIFLNNLYICFGYDLSTMENETANLYTIDTLNYNPKLGKQLSKTLNLRWIHTDPSGKKYSIKEFITTPDGDTTIDGKKADIYWYQYQIDAGTAHPWSGVSWKHLEEAKNTFSYTITPDSNSETTKIKVVIVYDDKYINSNIITFTNQSPEVIYESYQNTSILGFAFNDNSNGVYYIYNKNGYTDSKIESSVKKITCYYENSILTDATSITWDMPYGSSMVKPKIIDGENWNYFDSSGNEITNANEIYMAQRCSITRYQQNNMPINPSQEFTIYSSFSSNKTNNTIKCTILKNGVEYHYSQELLFGTFGTDGSNVTFVAFFPNEENKAFTLNESSTVPIQLSLRDRDGKEYLTSDNTYYKIYIDRLDTYTKEVEGILKSFSYKSQVENLFNDQENPQTDKTGYYLNNAGTIPLTWKDLSWRNKSTVGDNNTTWHQVYNSEGIVAVKEKEFTYYIDGSTSETETIKGNDNRFKINDDFEPFLYKQTRNDQINQTNFYSSEQDITVSESKPYNFSITKTVNSIYNSAAIFLYRITLSGWGDYCLKTYLAVPVRSNASLKQLNGPTQIIYTAEGSPTFDSSSQYKLLDSNNIEYDLTGCSIKSEDLTDNPSITGTAPNFRLNPKGFFVDNVKVCAVLATHTTGESEYSWLEPIVIFQNKYASGVIDEWDGKLTINEDNSYIITTAFAAGSKKEGQFSGVMMGDWSGKELNSEESISKQTGIYGFHQGAMSFAFKEDGTAFIGKSGGGRLEFDGNEAIIKSSGYDVGNGMEIDLVNNSIIAKKNNDIFFQINNAGAMFKGNISSSNIYGGSISGASIEIGDNFSVDTTGTLTASEAQINGQFGSSKAYLKQGFFNTSGGEQFDSLDFYLTTANSNGPALQITSTGWGDLFISAAGGLTATLDSNIKCYARFA